jgi:hypothetical protein
VGAGDGAATGAGLGKNWLPLKNWLLFTVERAGGFI